MRLEGTFQIAFGHDHMSPDTPNVLLYGKWQDGLKIDLVSKAPAISGPQELCIAAKNEERRLAELKRKRQYARNETFQQPVRANDQTLKRDERKKTKFHKQLRCYVRMQWRRSFCS